MQTIIVVLIISASVLYLGRIVLKSLRSQGGEGKNHCSGCGKE